MTYAELEEEREEETGQWEAWKRNLIKGAERAKLSRQ